MLKEVHEYILKSSCYLRTVLLRHYVFLTTISGGTQPNQTEVFMVQHITYFLSSDLSVVKPHDGLDPSS